MREYELRKFTIGMLVAGVLLGAAVSFCHAECLTNQFFPGIVCYSETRPEPPTRLFVTEIDLGDPHIQLRVAPGGPDPDGPGQWQTTLMRPTGIAAREGFDLVVNGDFFKARATRDAEGTNSTYRYGVWAAVNGPAVTDGKIWSVSTNALPCLVIHKNRKVTIEKLSRPIDDDWEVVAGNTMLLENSVVVPHQNRLRHPRTVVGLDANGTRLFLMVVDGRKPGVAVGMSYDELARELLRWGCTQALNLDGGGSSVIAVRDEVPRSYRILNEPTDGHERAVANVLGVVVKRPKFGQP
jgi:hypothetical protein